MIEKIGTNHYKKLSEPNRLFIDCILRLKEEKRFLSVAEIGIGIGATALAAFKALTNEDTYYIFDYQNKVDELSKELSSVPNAPDIKCYGNSRFSADNYSWTLYRLLKVQISTGEDGLFDVVLLDAAHDFTIDLAACSLLVELLKPGAFLLIDDVDLSFKKIIAHNPHNSEKYMKRYSQEQLDCCQMQMICQAFLDRNLLLQRVPCDDISVNIYRRKAD